MTGKGWGLLIFLALLILIFRFAVSEHILSILRGVYASLSPGAIMVIVLLFCVCVWALSSKPKAR